MELISRINMFDRTQTILLVDDESVIEKCPATLDNFSATVADFLIDYPAIDKITLFGNTDYNQKIKTDILSKDITKYNHKNIKIELRS